MADRTSAALFATIFERLAEDPERNWDEAGRLIEQAQRYDFNHYQMECDGALLKLGLARKRDGDIEYYLEDYDKRDADGVEPSYASRALALLAESRDRGVSDDWEVRRDEFLEEVGE
jgi:hypothetical protein